MANTVTKTNRTIEISAIDEDYTMDQKINVHDVVFIPGAADDVVDIVENSVTKVQLKSGDGEPRGWGMHGQRLQLGFVFADGTFSQGSMVIFNIGERGY
jgi:hypothetical protein